MSEFWITVWMVGYAIITISFFCVICTQIKKYDNYCWKKKLQENLPEEFRNFQIGCFNFIYQGGRWYISRDAGDCWELEKICLLTREAFFKGEWISWATDAGIEYEAEKVLEKMGAYRELLPLLEGEREYGTKV